MPLPYVSQNILATGFRSFVRIGNTAADAQNVGFVESYRITEDYQAQEARVLGQLMPIAIDAQGYNCSISLSGFLPSYEVYKKIRNVTAQMGYNLQACLFSFIPNSRDLMDNERLTKFPYMDLVENLPNPKILYSAEGVLINNVSMQAQATGYIKMDISMRALVGEKGFK